MIFGAVWRMRGFGLGVGLRVTGGIGTGCGTGGIKHKAGFKRDRRDGRKTFPRMAFFCRLRRDIHGKNPFATAASIYFPIVYL
jgi:hypothetical protein